jgi:putative AlgH/UPF0301 family transcriptional regulator
MRVEAHVFFNRSTVVCEHDGGVVFTAFINRNSDVQYFESVLLWLQVFRHNCVCVGVKKFVLGQPWKKKKSMNAENCLDVTC